MRKGENIGALRHRVTIEQATPSRDSYGQETLSWSTLATVWASYEYRINTSEEDEMAARPTPLSTVRWVMRYRSDVAPKMRVVDESSNIFDILSISPDAHKKYMILETENLEETA